jgi:2-succinyl-5-enolpyruvyl-6-hydroxy-3-cyclohexene-1-carboxylate synthase
VRSLVAAGVRDAVLSPGSRSAPLAIALAGEASLRLHVVVDERSAGFFALGQARATGAPSVLVCTSGTAGAHYAPALIEAAQSFVPMIVVTADRPWELYDAAAPQTIDQVKLFGGFVRHYAELGLPDASPSALRAVPRIAAQAVARALGPTPGPVHVDARFRKPLEPVDAAGPEPWEPLVEALMARGVPQVHAPFEVPSRAAVAEVIARIGRAERGVIVCGPAPVAQGAARAAILGLARVTGFPLLAEATSQMRFGGDRSDVIDGGAFDAVLRMPGLGPPDLVLQLGAPPTSAAYADLCTRESPPRVVVARHGWNDPHGDAAILVNAEPGSFAALLTTELGFARAPGSWARALGRAGARASAVAARAIATPALVEGATARALVASCPEDAILVVGNSTPVRDLDLFCAPSERPLAVAHQRGASGIDGLVSGAAGVASASARPVTLLLGDLSVLHDLTGLALLARARTPLVVVVVQNGGGRIFEQLPVAKRIDAATFERCFATPERVDLAHATAAFGVEYTRVDTVPALDGALREAWSRPAATLIEAVCAPHEGARIVERIRAELREPPQERGER